MTKRIAYILLTSGAFGLLLSSASAQKWSEEEIAAGVKATELTRHVLAGKKWPLQFILALNPDCSVVDGYEIKITKQPEHGTAELVPADRFPSYAKDNPRFRCNEKRMHGLDLIYKASDGYKGMDEFEVVQLSNGMAWE